MPSMGDYPLDLSPLPVTARVTSQDDEAMDQDKPVLTPKCIAPMNCSDLVQSEESQVDHAAQSKGENNNKFKNNDKTVLKDCKEAIDKPPGNRDVSLSSEVTAEDDMDAPPAMMLREDAILPDDPSRMDHGDVNQVQQSPAPGVRRLASDQLQSRTFSFPNYPSMIYLSAPHFHDPQPGNHVHHLLLSAKAIAYLTSSADTFRPFLAMLKQSDTARVIIDPVSVYLIEGMKRIVENDKAVLGSSRRKKVGKRIAQFRKALATSYQARPPALLWSRANLLYTPSIHLRTGPAGSGSARWITPTLYDQYLTQTTHSIENFLHSSSRRLPRISVCFPECSDSFSAGQNTNTLVTMISPLALSQAIESMNRPIPQGAPALDIPSPPSSPPSSTTPNPSLLGVLDTCALYSRIANKLTSESAVISVELAARRGDVLVSRRVSEEILKKADRGRGEEVLTAMAFKPDGEPYEPGRVFIEQPGRRKGEEQIEAMTDAGLAVSFEFDSSIVFDWAAITGVEAVELYSLDYGMCLLAAVVHRCDGGRIRIGDTEVFQERP
ncbi:hypothetical protein IAT38_006013 [Cryptococcus sp. DSM 104549]